MQLRFLGTGSAMPTGERYQSGILLESDGTRLLVDCGSGVLHRLAQTEAGYETLDGVLITHRHLDHVSDLLALLKARWLEGSGQLPILGPPGTEVFVEELLAVHAYLDGRLEFDVRDIETTAFEIVDFDVEVFETRHSMQSYAYRISPNPPRDRHGATVTISGDTEALEGLVGFAEGSDALVHDCSFPDDVDVSNHATPSELGEKLAGSDVGTVYLTHLYPHTHGRERGMVDTISNQYDGPVTIPSDGSSMTL